MINMTGLLKRVGEFGCIFLAVCPAVLLAQQSTQPKIMRGTVVAVRKVKAYVNALGADKDEWGNISCESNSGTITIKQTSLFRVETASCFYDLSKVCGGSVDNFRWPRIYKQGYTEPYDWKHYDELKIGDKVKLVPKMNPVQLTLRKCETLGLISVNFPKINFFGHNSASAVRRYKAYAKEFRRALNTRCRYKVPTMDVGIKWSTTEAGSSSPDVHDDTWDFRVVGSGPKSLANNTPVGPGYSATLPPP